MGLTLFLPEELAHRGLRNLNANKYVDVQYYHFEGKKL